MNETRHLSDLTEQKPRSRSPNFTRALIISNFCPKDISHCHCIDMAQWQAYIQPGKHRQLFGSHVVEQGILFDQKLDEKKMPCFISKTLIELIQSFCVR